MSKFNVNTAGSRKTVNKSGHAAYKMEDKEKLAAMVLTSMFSEAKFYGDNSDELVELATKVDPLFVAKLAMYARHEMNLRSVSHVLTAVLAKREDGKKYVRTLINGVVVRPDDMTEIVSCYLSMFGKPIPNSIKKGTADVLNRTDQYGFSKYSGKGKAVSMQDLLNISHPKPKDAYHEDLFKKVLNGELKVPKSWETELSSRGNTREVWEELIEEDRVGYMALLRNLRNIIRVQPRNIDKVYLKLSDRGEVLKSRQLPFRFYSAYKTLNKEGMLDSKTFGMLEVAIGYSTENIPMLTGNTLVAVDVSGSMGYNVSQNSTVTSAEIASLLGAMAGSICENATVVSFDTSLSNIAMSPKSGILQNASGIQFRGGGTDLRLPLEYMFKVVRDNQITFDRLIMLSDNEINSDYCWSGGGYKGKCQGLSDQYRKYYNSELWVHAVDLAGYGTQQFLGKNTNILAGWNERIFDFIHIAEEGKGNMVSTVEELYTIFDRIMQ